jgi:hypothetical protein
MAMGRQSRRYVPAHEREERKRLEDEATKILRRAARRKPAPPKRELIDVQPEPPKPGWYRLPDLKTRVETALSKIIGRPERMRHRPA